MWIKILVLHIQNFNCSGVEYLFKEIGHSLLNLILRWFNQKLAHENHKIAHPRPAYSGQRSSRIRGEREPCCGSVPVRYPMSVYFAQPGDTGILKAKLSMLSFPDTIQVQSNSDTSPVCINLVTYSASRYLLK